MILKLDTLAKSSSDPYETTKEIVSYFREITNYNWVGVRICNKHDLTRLVRFTASDQYDAIDKQWKKERFASIKDRAGFIMKHSLCLIKTGLGTQDIEVKQKGSSATRAEFNVHSKNIWVPKLQTKLFLMHSLNKLHEWRLQYT